MADRHGREGQRRRGRRGEAVGRRRRLRGGGVRASEQLHLRGREEQVGQVRRAHAGFHVGGSRWRDRPRRPRLHGDRLAQPERLPHRIADVRGRVQGHVQGRPPEGHGPAHRGVPELRPRRRAERGEAALVRAASLEPEVEGEGRRQVAPVQRERDLRLMAAGSHSVLGGSRPRVGRLPLSQLPDRVLKWGLTALAAGVLLLISYFFYKLIDQAQPSISKFGIFEFAFKNDWDVSRNIYGAAPLVVGTLITSALALVIGVPVAVAAALYVTELCPRRLKGPLTVLLELLAAVPSVVYGLWGVFVLIPMLKPAEEWFGRTFDWVPFVGPDVAGPNYFISGLILAIMILPIVSAISREVLATVPVGDKEAALALGATRWEMIRMAVLPYSRAGITGAAMLGLGRAIGETIAVTLVIGNAPQIGGTIFEQGYTLAAVIANDFGEAANDELHRAALIAAGLVLFVLTLLVNIVARGFVVRGERRQGRGAKPAATASAGAAAGAGG